MGLINNGGNPIEALKDLTSGDSLRSLATTVLSAGLAKGVCNVLELPTDIGIEKTPLEHIEVAAIRATVNGALNNDVGRLSATLAAIATDQDVTIASRTAANALENNYILLMLGVACTIYEIYEGVHLWRRCNKNDHFLILV